eukprot:scaffold1785_cov247-Pinguiococcus_pyrenoidosus.AAC.25
MHPRVFESLPYKPRGVVKAGTSGTASVHRTTQRNPTQHIPTAHLCRRAKWAPVAHVESYAAKLFHLHGHSGRDRSALKGRQRSGRDKGA